MTKFYLICEKCHTIIKNFKSWFDNIQKCPECASDQVYTFYPDIQKSLTKIFSITNEKRNDIWRYFPVLPLKSNKNIVSFDEGNVHIERWNFLENYSNEFFNIKCEVYAHRHDGNPATGSFKDLAGSVVASVLKENHITSYSLASTGNIGVSYTRYLTNLGINTYIFIPQNASDYKEAEIACFGQKVFRIQGDYNYTKKVAKEFSEEYGIMAGGASLCPMRLEAKKTIPFEWFRRMEKFPSVYLQALSGGTGPMGVYKGCNELKKTGLIKTMPRLFLVQSSRCGPMAEAYALAKKSGFKEGWEDSYPVYNNPETAIPTLATGNPMAYPVLAKMVYESKGNIVTFNEDAVIAVAKLCAFEIGARIGPSAAVAVGGFFSGLAKKSFKNGDIVLVNIGEGIRREPGFMLKISEKTKLVKGIQDCSLYNRDETKKQIWADIEKYKNDYSGTINQG